MRIVTPGDSGLDPSGLARHPDARTRPGAVLALLILLLLGGAGCLGPDPKAADEAAPKRDDRVASLAWLGSPALVGGRPVLEFLRDRQAVIAANVATIGTQLNATPDTRFGMAAAIASDGYYVTAAHCVAGANHWLLATTPVPGRCTWRPGRVVFDGGHDVDLALVKVEGPIGPTFEWAETARVTSLTLVVGAGLARGINVVNGQLVLDISAVAGLLLESPPPERVVNYPATVIHSRVPGWKGDSGSAVVYPNGKLLGITRSGAEGEVDGKLTWVWADHVRPEPVWIERLIAQDRAAHLSSR